LIDDPLTVQVQRRDGGAADRGEANHHCVIIAPGKMFAPVMLARVKQRNCFLAERINGRGLIVFEIVTALAGACEVIRITFSASRKRDDVFVGERIRAVIFLAKTIFAAALRALLNQQAQLFGEPPSSHAKPV